MLAAIATAVPLPNLPLISLVTESQTACLREEITTLAPCSAIRSAIARPIPREEPVMTATFPDKSNKVMLFPPILRTSFRNGRSDRIRNFENPGLVLTHHPGMTLRELGFHDLRSRRLVHCLVRCIRNPWLLVHHRQTPAAVPRTCEMIEPR